MNVGGNAAWGHWTEEINSNITFFVSSTALMEKLTEQIRVMHYPLTLGGTQIGRRVTLIRLTSGELVVHSTAPFSKEDVAAISNFGSPSALVDATFFHDTFARQGKESFHDVPYFKPSGFEVATGVTALSLSEPPKSWRGELEVLPLEGIPKVREHVFFHPASRTLIVADLVFNLGPTANWWTRFFFKNIPGIPHPPGVSRIFRTFIRDRAAFGRSVRTMMKLDFDRVIVGHGDIIERDGKAKMATALRKFLKD